MKTSVILMSPLVALICMVTRDSRSHGGSGGLDREASEPPQVPSDINRTTVERNTQPDPPEPCEDREHDVGSNNTPSRLLPELQTSLRRHRNSSGTVKVDDSKYDSDFG